MKFLILKYFCLLPAAFCLLLLAGCEWSTGGGAQTWNDRENFVDFSGSYKNADGGVIVRLVGAGAGSTTNTTFSTNSVTGEVLATGNGATTAFAGVLANANYKPGTLTIVVGGYRINDPSTASAVGTVTLTVSPADGTAGTLNLNTGAWTLSFPAPIANGTQFLAAYQFLSSASVVTSNQGNHGDPIFSFVLYQQGNTIQLIDNNNSRYTGYIGNVRTTGGVPIDLDPSRPNPVPASGPIVAQLFAEGASQGYSVQIAGVLQGTLSAGTTLSGRTMRATFIEIGGMEGDINGTAQ